MSDEHGNGNSSVPPDNNGEESSEKQILEALQNVVKELPEDKQREKAQLSNALRVYEQFRLTHMEQHSGPLPRPEDLAKYGEVVPGLDRTIVEMAQKEQDIRGRRVAGQLSNERFVAVCSTIVSLSVLGVAGLATYFGNAWIAVPLGSIGFVSLMVNRWLNRNR